MSRSLYDTTTPTDAPAPSSHPLEEIAGRLYKTPGPTPRGFYPDDVALKPAFVARQTELADVLGETEVERTARAQAPAPS